ncbi:Striatin-3 [Halotydeus destructor]|nr:Striatin-3 [Halotydeus destructor]
MEGLPMASAPPSNSTNNNVTQQSGFAISGGSLNQNNNNGIAVSSSNQHQSIQHQQSQQQQQQQYTIPGILHFLQYEWQRFELERQQWDVERAELQARISLLQGERKGQENLKNDLIRRIKMLEYCLRQERAKFHKLKYGEDMPPTLGQTEELNQFNNDPLLEDSLLNGDTTGSGVNWKHGRQLLRQYLQEIGYTDTIIDVRSNRVRSLLGLNTSIDDNIMEQSKLSVQQNKAPRKPNSVPPQSAIVADTEASVLATFEFLNDQRDSSGGRSVNSTDDDEDVEEDEDMVDDGEETEEVLAEFDFLSAHQPEQKEPGWRSGPPKTEIDIGELAALTVANESMEINGGPNTNNSLQNTLNSEFRKTWNPRYILKSHFDSVRCLRFHPLEPLLVTSSEDETLKLWNLNKIQQPSNKGKQQQATPSNTYDLEPVYTFRGHTSRVLTLTMTTNTIYSGAQNGELFIWSLPANIGGIDPYDAYDASLSAGSLTGHKDAIWSLLTIEGSNGAPLLCSASADATVRIWDTNTQQCTNTISLTGDSKARPTCIAAVSPHNNNNALPTTGTLIAVSFTNGSICIYDIESTSSQEVLSFENTGTPSRINSIVVHPALPVLVSAHEDKQIKFWDLNTGKCQQTMVAHLDEVTCLACDPNGLYLLSGSHDCSIRLWNFESRTCVQEIMSHRKKFDEAIFDVTFHPSKPFFASAGADGLAKVFV